MTIYELLMYIISGGGSAAITFWFLNTPAGHGLVDWLVNVALPWTGIGEREMTRYVSVALSAGVAMAAYAAAAGLGYVQFPTTAEGWLNLILALAGLGFTGSQVLHGAVDLRRRDREK